MNALTESVLEQAALDWFQALRRRRVQELGARECGEMNCLPAELNLPMMLSNITQYIE